MKSGSVFFVIGEDLDPSKQYRLELSRLVAGAHVYSEEELALQHSDAQSARMLVKVRGNWEYLLDLLGARNSEWRENPTWPVIAGDDFALAVRELPALSVSLYRLREGEGVQSEGSGQGTMAIRPTGSPDESPAPVQARAVSIDDRYQSPKEEEAIIVSNPHRNRAHTFLFNTADFGNGESFDPLELELAHNEVLAATLAALKALASRTAPQSIDTSANRAVQAAERYLRAHSVCRRTVSIGLRVEHLQLWGEIHRVVHELAAQNARSCRCSRTRHSSGSWRSQWLDRLRHWFLCVIDEMFSK